MRTPALLTKPVSLTPARTTPAASRSASTIGAGDQAAGAGAERSPLRRGCLRRRPITTARATWRRPGPPPGGTQIVRSQQCMEVPANVEVVTPSLRRRSCSVALRWCSSALATICVPANAGVDHVGAAGGRDHVGDVRAIRAIRVSQSAADKLRREMNAGLRRVVAERMWLSACGRNPRGSGSLGFGP